MSGGFEPECDPLMPECPFMEGCYEVQGGFSCEPGNQGASGAAGMACNSDFECNSGLFCGSPDEMAGSCEGAGIGCCREFCDIDAPDHPECGGAERCLPYFAPREAPTQALESLGQCSLELCDPLLQNCPNGESCVPNPVAFYCQVDASGAGGGDNDPCTFPNACDPGFICANPAIVDGCTGEVGCCQPLCDVSQATHPLCTLEEECLPWFETPPEGLENVGVCALPQ